MTSDDKKALFGVILQIGIPVAVVTWLALKFFFCWETVIALLFIYVIIFGCAVQASQRKK